MSVYTHDSSIPTLANIKMKAKQARSSKRALMSSVPFRKADQTAMQKIHCWFIGGMATRAVAVVESDADSFSVGTSQSSVVQAIPFGGYGCGRCGCATDGTFVDILATDSFTLVQIKIKAN
jgi:hypothetical protein